MIDVWVTRSQPGADVLAQLLRQRGVSVLNQPVIDIETLDCTFSPQTPDLVIVASAHAARAYLQAGQTRSGVTHLAVGSVTQQVLTHGGVPAEVAQPESSEGVLMNPTVRSLKSGARVWLLAGEGGRQLIVDELTQAGMQVVKYALYRRQVTALSGLGLETTRVVEISSVTTLEAVTEHLNSALPEGETARPVAVVPSARLLDAVHDRGYAGSQADSAAAHHMAPAIVAALATSARDLSQ